MYLPKIADYGGLIIGVPINDPNTPPIIINKNNFIYD
jgi:hypothetical protein